MYTNSRRSLELQMTFVGEFSAAAAAIVTQKEHHHHDLVENNEILQQIYNGFQKVRN